MPCRCVGILDEITEDPERMINIYYGLSVMFLVLYVATIYFTSTINMWLALLNAMSLLLLDSAHFSLAHAKGRIRHLPFDSPVADNNSSDTLVHSSTRPLVHYQEADAVRPSRPPSHNCSDHIDA